MMSVVNPKCHFAECRGANKMDKFGVYLKEED